MSMSETMITADSQCPLAGRVIERLGVGLSVTGVLVVALTAMLCPVPIPIERPWILAIASSLLLVPAREHRFVLLQRFIGLYLIAVLFNQVYDQYATVSIASRQIGISRSVGPLLLCAAGSVLMWFRPKESIDVARRARLLWAWCTALGIAMAHLLILALLLHRFYGYGYENDFRVLAHLALYFLLFLVLKRPLDHRGSRILSGLTLLVSYAVLQFH